MKAATLLALAPLIPSVLASPLPNFPFDPNTTADCIEWVDVTNSTAETCESTLRYWGINPTQFHAWNPSVGLGCEGWQGETSYCIVTRERLDTSVQTTDENGFTVAIMTTDADGWRIPVTRSGGVMVASSSESVAAMTTTTTTPTANLDISSSARTSASTSVSTTVSGSAARSSTAAVADAAASSGARRNLAMFGVTWLWNAR